ncbi:DNA-binding protein [Aeromonas sanarellii]
MRPAEFSLEEIIAAGEALVAAGRNVTGFALRQKVGGGNPNRLKQVWGEHLAAKNTTEAEPVAELPIEVAEEVAAVTKALTERLSTLAVELNDKAVKAAERRVAEVLRTAGEQREQAERELVDAAQTVDDLEAQLDESQAAIESLEKQLGESQARGQGQAVELAQLRERLAATEQSARAAADTHARELELAAGEIKAVRTELDGVRRDAGEKIEALRDELTQSRERLAASQQSAKVATDETKAIRTELDSARRESAEKVESLRGELAEQKAKSAADAQAHADYRARTEQDIARLSEQLEQSRTGLDVARREAAEARETAAKIAGQLEATQEQNTTLLTAVQHPRTS